MQTRIRNVMIVAIMLTCVMPCWAQMPTPAKEMAILDPLIGNWEGEGTVTMIPGQPPLPWKSVTTFKKVLDGFFVQEDMQITFPGHPMLGNKTMCFRGYYAWNATTKRFDTFGFGNDGSGIKPGHYDVAGDGVLIGVMGTLDTSMGARTPVADRWVLKIGKDGYSMTGDRLAGVGKPFTFVQGKMKRSSDKSADASKITDAIAPPANEMAALGKGNGKWRFTGSMSPMPGFPMQPISGGNTITSMLGGHIQANHVRGDKSGQMPKAYEGYMFIAWDNLNKRYTSISLGNFGEFHTQSVYAQGGKLIYMGHVLQYGQPVCVRTIQSHDAKTDTVTIRSHTLSGTHDPVESFKIVCTRAK